MKLLAIKKIHISYIQRIKEQGIDNNNNKVIQILIMLRNSKNYSLTIINRRHKDKCKKNNKEGSNKDSRT